MNRKNTPEINAGSMADIAFLLLIFFLVTTTLQVDSGIQRKIPEKHAENLPIVIKNKNFLEINLNAKNELFVEEAIIDIADLRELVLNFIDNNGKNQNFSDNPTKAFIGIKSAREANYKTYIEVLDIINSAYMQLRNQLALTEFNTTYSNLETQLRDSKNKDEIKKKIEFIRATYPLLVSDL